MVYFYNPFLWAANAVIRRLRDEAADEAVVEIVGDRESGYTQRLAEVARLPLRQPSTSDLSLIGVA